ncbi:MAG TPA: STAS domain-containing protein, partial [Capillimicrobium sp.]
MDDLDQDLTVSVERDEGVPVVTITGELDAASADAVGAPLQDAIDAGGGLVLDLLGCGFLDSTGLHAIIDAESAVVSRGGRFAIACRPGGAVARTLDVALPGML